MYHKYANTNVYNTLVFHHQIVADMSIFSKIDIGPG